jgi:hypothetical protein
MTYDNKEKRTQGERKGTGCKKNLVERQHWEGLDFVPFEAINPLPSSNQSGFFGSCLTIA